ncbi:MAG: hypothetical protein FJ290_03710 [Planctomycetes bacterium]|nr:hypothetical protein [Planctomycetota bacterium]
MERRRAPEAVLALFWVAAAIYFGAKSLEPDEEVDLDSLPIPATVSDVQGVPNLLRLSEDLLRGAQPNLVGFRALKALGIKTVVNLRHYHSDRYMIDKVGLDYEHIDVKSWGLRGGHIARFLEIATDGTKTPVFIHCHDGIGRTGVMCAMYRIVVQGWTREAALKEMIEFGPWDEKGLRKMLERIDETDVDRLKRHFAPASRRGQASQ